MEKISKFVECLLPITICNLKCHYCYVIQRNNRLMKKAVFRYSVDKMVSSLTKERMGGVTFFSICGAGETLLCSELPDLVKGLLANGHYVNLTTNGTVSKAIEKIIEITPREDLSRLQFAFSYHYLELERLNLGGGGFKNVNKVKAAGCSFLVQLNLCDEYIPYIDDIKRRVKQNIGAYPQVAATRKEDLLHSKVQLYTQLSEKEYMDIGRTFDSPLFDFTMKNFNVKRKEYCYAGEWSYVLNLENGILQACYGSLSWQNIFENNKPIALRAIGRHCGSLFCMNSSHFLSMGIVPSLKTPTYCELRDRKTNDGHWYNDIMREALSHKLEENNIKHGIFKRVKNEFSFIKERLKLSFNKIGRK